MKQIFHLNVLDQTTTKAINLRVLELISKKIRKRNNASKNVEKKNFPCKIMTSILRNFAILLINHISFKNGKHDLCFFSDNLIRVK